MPWMNNTPTRRKMLNRLESFNIFNLNYPHFQSTNLKFVSLAIADYIAPFKLT